MVKIGDPVRVTEKGLLVIRSTESNEECQKYGMSYEWSITMYLYSADKEKIQKFFGLSDSNYLYWLKLLAKRSLQNRNKERYEEEGNKN